MLKRGVLFILLSLPTIAGCDKGDTGYVQLRVVPPNAVATIALYLDSSKLDFSRSSSVTLQFKTGLVALKELDSAWAPAICKVRVRKDRISALTVLLAQNPPRCVCEIRAPESTENSLVCG